MLKWRTTKIEDCEQLAPNIHRMDAQELYDATGLDVYQGLVMSINLCDDCETGINEHNEILAIRGVQKLTTHGIVWAILTKQAYKKAGFKTAIKWLQHIGFSITKKIDDYGYAKKSFYEFERTL